MPKHTKTDIYEELTPLEQKTRKAAIILAFIGVFVWTVKILFF
jgi:hypothetical protein